MDGFLLNDCEYDIISLNYAQYPTSQYVALCYNKTKDRIETVFFNEATLPFVKKIKTSKRVKDD